MEKLRGVVYTAFVLFTLMSTAAFACEGQVGQVIYEDTFTDDSGAWDFTPNAATGSRLILCSTWTRSTQI